MKILKLIVLCTFLVSGISYAMKLSNSLLKKRKLNLQKKEKTLLPDSLNTKEKRYPYQVKRIENTINFNRLEKQKEQSVLPLANIINNQLKLDKIEDNLREKEQNQIKKLLQECRLTQEQVNKTFENIKKSHKKYREILSTPLPPKPTEKTNIFYSFFNKLFNYIFPPLDLTQHFDFIDKQLKQKRLLKENIQFKVEKSPFKINAIYDEAKVIIKNFMLKDEPCLKNVSVTLLIEPKTVNNKHIKAILAHEIGHILEGHPVTKCTIRDNLAYFLNKDINDFNNLKEYTDICNTHEEQAEIFPSITSPEHASLIREYRKGTKNYYPGVLYHKHYQQLAEIHEIHKMNSFLKKELIKPQLNKE